MTVKKNTKQAYFLAITTLGALLAMPAVAHHMSLDSDFVEDHMPDNALEQHNLAVDEVLDMGVAQMAGGGVDDSGTMQMTRDEMDPADNRDGTMTVRYPYDLYAPFALRSPPIPED